MSRLPRAGLVLLAAAAFAQAAAAQSGTVTGFVVDSAGAPIPDVMVFVDQGPRFVSTDGSGAFTLADVGVGAHVLSFRRNGFAPRSFSLTVAAGAPSRDVGSIRLLAGSGPRASLAGRVIQEIDGAPVADAAISLNGVTVARTDAQGTFTIAAAPVRWGPNDVTITHSGVNETSASDQFWITSSDEIVDLDVALDVAPIALPGVAVAARSNASSPRLQAQGFYERERASSNAVFYTAEDIAARQMKDWQDVLRGIRFTRTRAFTSFGNAGDVPEPSQFASPRAAALMAEREGQCGTDTDPIAFLDGNFVGRLSQLVETVRVETIEGVEIYRGVASLPVQFNREGAECGVVAVWSLGSF